MVCGSEDSSMKKITAPKQLCMGLSCNVVILFLISAIQITTARAITIMAHPRPISRLAHKIPCAIIAKLFTKVPAPPPIRHLPGSLPCISVAQCEVGVGKEVAIGIPATFLNLILAPSRCSKWKEPRIQEQSNQRQAREGRAAGPFDLLRERENNMNATKNLGTVDFISPMTW